MSLLQPTSHASYQTCGGTIAAIMSSICFGIVPFLALQLYANGFGAVSILFWRSVLSCLLLTPLLWVYSSPSPRLWLDGLLLAGLGGLLGAPQSYCFFTAIKVLPTSVASVIFFTYPITTVLIERVVFGVPVTRRMIATVVLVVVGAALTLAPTGDVRDTDPVGLLWIIPVPILYGFYLALSSRLGAQHAPFFRAIMLQSGMMLAFAGLITIEGLQVPWTQHEWAVITLCALCGGVLAIPLFAYGITRTGASVYGVLSGTELVTVVGIGLLFLGERLSVLQTIGMIFVLAGVMFNVSRSRARLA
jgi:drug/metabolite transporter (DMT)-like permease